MEIHKLTLIYFSSNLEIHRSSNNVLKHTNKCTEQIIFLHCPTFLCGIVDKSVQFTLIIKCLVKIDTTRNQLSYFPLVLLVFDIIVASGI